MFSKEELKEIKLSLNEMVLQRQKYMYYEKNLKRLEDNKKYLDMDYELIAKIIKLEEEM